MKARQVYIIFGILILIGGYIASRWIAGLKEAPAKEKEEAVARKLPVIRFHPDTVASTVPISGRVRAARKVEVYAEVSGILKNGSHPFKAGIRFRKGETLVSMADRELRMDLKAQKSQFLNAITELLPDLKLDFPDAHKRWKAYLDRLEVGAPIPPLPEVKKKQVKYFVASRNLFDRYYSIKSREVRLGKYRIEAPFSGVLTASNIDPGTLVRNGQKLGEFIDPDSYELVASVGVKDLQTIEEGDPVRIRSSELQGEWKGRIARINHRIDPGTQSIEVYIPLEDPKLKEGMYMEGRIEGSEFHDAVKLPRKLLQEERYVWTVRDSTLSRKEVELLHTLPDEVVVRGIDEKDQLIEQPFPGAYKGMPAIPVTGEAAEAEADTL
jgi:multidrug efflux pump subunit AcrA (membrane-fusion protein)